MNCPDCDMDIFAHCKESDCYICVHCDGVFSEEEIMKKGTKGAYGKPKIFRKTTEAVKGKLSKSKSKKNDNIFGKLKKFFGEKNDRK